MVPVGAKQFEGGLRDNFVCHLDERVALDSFHERSSSLISFLEKGTSMSEPLTALDAAVTIVFGVYAEKDMVEGRGGKELRALFTTEDEAYKFADSNSGIMGRKPEDGTWKNSRMSDWKVEPMPLYESAEQLDKAHREEVRLNALKKLSPLEREVLGLS